MTATATAAARAAARQVAEPRWVLIEVEGGQFEVWPFGPEWLSPWGWSMPGVTLIGDSSELSHLRDRIVN